MAKSKKSTSSIKEIKKLEEEIKYDVEIVENLQKKSILSQDDLDLIKLFNQKIQEKTEKLQALKGITDELRDSSDDYESVLRSIGNKYGEINSIYKESEKILALNKEEISGILSITGLLNSSNTKLIDGILESQKAYKGITTSIVENIGGLEDSESSYKKINFEIAKQEELIGSIQKELKNIDKSDELQVKAAEELSTQLNEQTVALGKMRKAGENVKKTMDAVNMLGSDLSSTMFGGWVDQFLKITKVLGITNFDSITGALESIGKKTANDELQNIVKTESVTDKKVPPLTQPEAVQQSAAPAQTQVPPPTQPESVQSEYPKPIKTEAITTKDIVQDAFGTDEKTQREIKESAEKAKQLVQTQVPPLTQPEAIQQNQPIDESNGPIYIHIDDETIKELQESAKNINQSTQPQIPPPTQPEVVQQTQQTQTPQPSMVNVSTEGLEKEQTKYSQQTAKGISAFNRGSSRQRQLENRAKRVEFEKNQFEKKEPKIEAPNVSETNIGDANKINIDNSAATLTLAGDYGKEETAASVSAAQKQAEFTDAAAAQLEKTTTDITRVETDRYGKSMDASNAAMTAAQGIPGVGPFIAAGIGAAAMGVALAKLAIEVAKYEDSLESATDKLVAFRVSSEEGAKKFTEDVLSDKDSYAIEKIRNTKEFRNIQFQYTIASDVKERQNLETDYFNFQKGVFFDYYNYQNEIVRQNIDYELGLRKDALQFQFQQQSANLDAELEKRKTLAGSAMKFIGNYSKVAERALNAIGSSTKSIMDGMKQFGAVLGGTNKSQFELVENAQGLAYAYGGSMDQVLNMSHMFKLLGNTTDKIGMGLTEGLKGFVEEQGGNVQSVFSEIVEASAEIYRLMSATPDQIAKQTVALQKAGTKLSTMLKASDTMVLNYKDSIKAEMSLGAMIGQNVNLTQARAALMSGDMVGAANAIRQSLGGIDVNQLNPFAKQELARATGLSMDQIIQIQQGGQIETDEEKQLKQAKETGKAIANSVLAQDVANAGARLALEQSQRKQMLEMEQAQRLVMLRLEQKQKLEQIPIESAYRFYWDKVYAFKFAKEDFTVSALQDVLTSTFTKGGGFGTTGAADFLNKLESQLGGGMMQGTVTNNLQTLGVPYAAGASGQITIPSLNGNMVTGNVSVGTKLNPQLESLGNTIVTLDNKVNDLNISSRDVRYQQWLLGSHDISQKYKGGKTPELAEKEYNDLFNKLFSADMQLQSMNQTVQSTLGNAIDIKNVDDRESYFEIIKKFSDNQKIDKGFFGGDYATIDGKEFALNVLKGSEEDIELRNVIQKKLDQQRQLQMNQVDILKQQLQQGKITQDTFNSKINELKNSMNINLNIQQPTSLPNKFVDNSEELKKAEAMNPSYFKDGKPIAGPVPSSTKYNPFPFTPNTTTTPNGLNSFASPIGTQFGAPTGITTPSVTTTQNAGNNQIQTSVPSPTTPPPAANIPPPSQVTVNMESTNSILSKIQSEADQRGITMYTKQIDQNGNLQMIVTRTQNTAAAVETTKPDIKRVADIGVTSSQNLEQIQIEMIKELQTANELLVGVLNNTAPTDKGMIINLDGSKIAQNFIGRMNNRRSFNGSNTVPTRV